MLTNLITAWQKGGLSQRTTFTTVPTNGVTTTNSLPTNTQNSIDLAATVEDAIEGGKNKWDVKTSQVYRQWRQLKSLH